ncbi:hypothetical protein ACXY7D_10665 [Sphingomonas melonis]
MAKLLPLLTLRNIKIAASIALALASAFGVVAPNTATKLRNAVLVPLDVATATTGDLL